MKLKRVIPKPVGDRICPKCHSELPMESFIGAFGYYISLCESCNWFKNHPE